MSLKLTESENVKVLISLAITKFLAQEYKVCYILQLCILYQVPEVTEGEAFHDCIALMINVKAKIKNAVAIPALNTSNGFIIVNCAVCCCIQFTQQDNPLKKTVGNLYSFVINQRSNYV